MQSSVAQTSENSTHTVKNNDELLNLIRKRQTTAREQTHFLKKINRHKLEKE
jgi:hypothetical protein